MALARNIGELAQPVGDGPDSLSAPAISRPTWEVVPGFALNDAYVSWERPEARSAPVAVTAPALVLPTPYELEARQLRALEVLTPLQEWEGVVLEVSVEGFLARISDASGDHEDEEVELSSEEVSEIDRPLVEPGAIFYWTIGYRQRLPIGTRERVSRLRFRRLPAWTKRELEEARDRAAELARELDW
jgi:hypothetical protein